MIQIKNLTKKYKLNTIIDDLSFEFNEEISFLYGDNGAGKSTLINMLAGVVKPNSGYISIAGKQIKYTDGTYKKNIGFSIDLPTYPSHLKLKEYINLSNYIYQNEKEINKTYQEELIDFFELQTFLEHEISELSTGFIKRVKLMASMLHNPKLLIWDEPFSGLDKNFLSKLIIRIIELSKSGSFFLITSHVSQIIDLKIDNMVKYQMTNGKIKKI